MVHTTHYLKDQTVGHSRELSAKRALTRGTPQGRMLSPLVWNMTFGDLPNQFDKGSVKTKGFTDAATLVAKLLGLLLVPGTPQLCHGKPLQQTSL